MTRKQSETLPTGNATDLSSWLHSALDQLELTLASDVAKGLRPDRIEKAEIHQSGHLPDVIPRACSQSSK